MAIGEGVSSTMRIIQYKPELKTLARKLRHNSTQGEVMLWSRLRGRQMLGYKFIRQKPIAKYVVDFFCRELKLIIEVDGYSHEGSFEEDQIRQNKLEELGLNILRFSESEVRRDIEQVLTVIEAWIRSREKVR